MRSALAVRQQDEGEVAPGSGAVIRRCKSTARPGAVSTAPPVFELGWLIIGLATTESPPSREYFPR
jgi:hypothetical protein